MTELAQRLRAELERLPAADRAELARYLIGSLDTDSDPDVEAAWDAELARRVDEIRTAQDSGESADSVFARLRKKYS